MTSYVDISVLRMFSVFLALLVAASPAFVATTAPLSSPNAATTAEALPVAASPALLSSPKRRRSPNKRSRPHPRRAVSPVAFRGAADPAFDQGQLGICWACSWAAVAAQNSRFCRDLPPNVLKDGLATFSTDITNSDEQPEGAHIRSAHPIILTNLRRAVAAGTMAVANKVRPDEPFNDIQIRSLERCVATMRLVTIPMLELGNGLPRLPLGGKLRLPGGWRLPGLPGNRSDRFADKVERHLPVCPKDGRRGCRRGGRPFIFNLIFATYAAAKILGRSGRLPNPKEDTAAEMTEVSFRGNFTEIQIMHQN